MNINIQSQKQFSLYSPWSINKRTKWKNLIKTKTGFIIFFLFVAAITCQSLPVSAQETEINLIDEQHMWLPFGAAFVSQNFTGLNIIVSTSYNGTLFNRAYLPIEITSDTNNSLIFALQYSSISYLGNAAFFSEIRDNKTNQILWSTFLNDTSNQLANKTFSLPPTILNKPLEVRFYIWTNGPGEHILDVKKAVIRSANETQLV